MKSVEDTLLQRRSIRRYEREDIPESSLALIYKAIQNTPTSYNGQQYSVIDVSDQEVKEQLYELTGQKQIKTCRRFLVFCSDYNKIKTIAAAKGIDMPDFYNTLDGLVVGTVDASLAMMSAVVAAESEGLGTCCVGYARTKDPEKIAQILGLPEHVFVVCGLCIGVPRELPDLKPKEALPLLIHQNRYNTEDIEQELLEYDKEVTHYNETRTGTKSRNDWVGHIINYYREAMDYDMLCHLRTLGYDIKK